MKKDIVIKVEKLSKRYSIGKREKYLTLRDRLIELPQTIFKKNKKKQDFWALKNVSFEVKRGEVLGIIGRNGAGKSTLLKILSRITEPTKGKITMKGKVASMLEVGTGFNPELTGRENIYLNGAILGMSKSEIRSKFDQITEFAGIGKFLDTPVKRYSSGMYVRLAFAVAAHLDSDILLVDEVLAVGDAEFQKKCLGKMGSLAKSGKTVIFVSHNLESMASICHKVILLKKGKIILIDKTNIVIRKYLNTGSFINDALFDKTVSRDGKGKVFIEKVIIYGKKKNITPEVGGNLNMELYIKNNYEENVEVRVSASIRGLGQKELISLDSELLGWRAIIKKKDLSVISCKVKNLNLNSGDYELNLATYYKNELEDWIVPACTVRISPKNIFKHIRNNHFPILANFSWRQ